jgi:hypothetical protein
VDRDDAEADAVEDEEQEGLRGQQEVAGWAAG